MLARKGRKRRGGVARYPSGGIVQADRQPREDIQGVVKAYRLKYVRESDVTDQKAESPLGVYLLRGLLKEPGEKTNDNAEARYHAGLQYAAVVAANRRDMGSPSEDATNRVLANLLPGDAGKVRALRTDEELRAAQNARRKRYQAAYEALRQASIWAFDAVYTVAVREKGIAPEKLPKLREGLDALAVHFKLGRGA